MSSLSIIQKENMIPYESLSKEIKNEIEHFHEQKVRKGFARDLRATTKEWFDTHFEEWVVQNNPLFTTEGQRKNIRIDIELPLTVADTLIDNEQSAAQEFDIVGNIQNISRGGLYFKTDTPYNASTILKLRIDFSTLDPAFPEVEALAMVVRCDQLSDSVYGVGVAFSSVYDDERDTINMFIFKQLIRYIHNPDT